MVKKESLRDLQSRLSERLRLANTQAVSMAWLAVLIGQKHFLFPLSESGEIFSMPGIARVPYTKPWFSGVVNLRGGLYGVIDFAWFMEPACALSRQQLDSTQCRLITLNVDVGINSALIVDGLLGLRRPPAFVSDEPAPEQSPPYFGRQFLDAQGIKWQEIDLHGLAQMPGFLGVGI